MASRRRSRQRALQILFSWDARRRPATDVIDEYYDGLYEDERPERDPFVLELVKGTVGKIDDIDDRVPSGQDHRAKDVERLTRRGVEPSSRT